MVVVSVEMLKTFLYRPVFAWLYYILFNKKNQVQDIVIFAGIALWKKCL